MHWAQAGDLKPVLEVLNKARLKAAALEKERALAAETRGSLDSNPEETGKPRRRKSMALKGSLSEDQLRKQNRRRSRSSRGSAASLDEKPGAQ